VNERRSGDPDFCKCRGPGSLLCAHLRVLIACVHNINRHLNDAAMIASLSSAQLPRDNHNIVLHFTECRPSTIWPNCQMMFNKFIKFNNFRTMWHWPHPYGAFRTVWHPSSGMTAG